MNLEQKILDKNGKVATVHRKTTKMVKGKEVESLKKEDMTIGILVRNVLLNKGDDCDPVSHLKRYNLWSKIKDAKEIELSEEEKDLLIKLCAEKLDILATAQIINSLN